MRHTNSGTAAMRVCGLGVAVLCGVVSIFVIAAACGHRIHIRWDDSVSATSQTTADPNMIDLPAGEKLVSVNVELGGVWSYLTLAPDGTYRLRTRNSSSPIDEWSYTIREHAANENAEKR